MNIYSEKDAEDFLEKNGFNVAKRVLIKDFSKIKEYSSKIGFPVAFKNPDLLHKTGNHGVAINVDESNFEKSLKEIMLSKPNEILVQKYIEGTEILVGIKKDNAFGHVIVFGLGGVFTEIMKDVSFRICPVDKKEALNMIKEIKAHKILEGYRGNVVNINSLVDVITKLSKLAHKYQDIKELDLNPLIVNKKDSTIVDARIIFE